MVEVLVVGLIGVGCQELVSGWIGKLMVRLRKVIILVEDDHSVALIGRENKDVRVVAEGAGSAQWGGWEGVWGFVLAVGLESRKAGMMVSIRGSSPML